MNHSAISYQISVVFYEFKSWLLIIKSDRYDLSYHRIFSMVFKATITIEWNGWGQPSCSMVFRWFLGPPKWLSTIGQTMRCDGPSFQSRWFRWLATKPRSHPFRQGRTMIIQEGLWYKEVVGSLVGHKWGLWCIWIIWGHRIVGN